jgi:hypothetical protein
VSTIIKGICWAGTILLVASLQKLGWMDRPSTLLLITLLPALAIATMHASGRCDICDISPLFRGSAAQ